MARPLLLPLALAGAGFLWVGAIAVAGEQARAPVAGDARQIQGRVLDAEGWPLPGARVYLLRDAPDQPAGGPPLLETTTDDDGHFSFDALEPGSYRIDIEARDHQLAHVGAHLTGGTTPFAPVEVHMRPQTTSVRASGGYRAPPAANPAAATPGAPAREPPPAPYSSAAEAPLSAIEPREAPASRTAVKDDVSAPEPSNPDPWPQGADADGARAELQHALEAGQIPRARSILAGIEGHRVEDADLFYAVGEALLRAGETEAALHTLDEALARDPAHVEARYRRALALLGLGRRDDARDEFSRVLELRPSGDLADGARKALAALAPAGSTR